MVRKGRHCVPVAVSVGLTRDSASSLQAHFLGCLSGYIKGCTHTHTHTHLRTHTHTHTSHTHTLTHMHLMQTHTCTHHRRIPLLLLRPLPSSPHQEVCTPPHPLLLPWLLSPGLTVTGPRNCQMPKEEWEGPLNQYLHI